MLHSCRVIHGTLEYPRVPQSTLECPMVLDGAAYPRMLNAGGRCALCRRPLRPRQHLRSPLPHLHRDWTHPCLICPGVDVVRGEPSSGGYAGGTSPLRHAALPLRYRCGCAQGTHCGRTRRRSPASPMSTARSRLPYPDTRRSASLRIHLHSQRPRSLCRLAAVCCRPGRRRFRGRSCA